MTKIIAFVLLNMVSEMEPIKQPKPIFKQNNIKVFLEKGKDIEICLKRVALYEPTNSPVFFWGSDMEEEKFKELNIEFTLFFEWISDKAKGGEILVAVAHFTKDNDTGKYKIYQASFLEDMWMMDTIPSIDGPPNSIPVRLSFQASKGKYRYVGDSDNEDLLSVKVWKHVQKKRYKR